MLNGLLVLVGGWLASAAPTAAPAPPAPSAPNAELLYLVHRDPEELADACNAMRPADVAESLRRLPPEAGARVLGALPFDLAVQAGKVGLCWGWEVEP